MEANKILLGDALSVLKNLPDAYVQMVCTSPPYFGLRHYLPDGHTNKPLEIGQEETPEEYIDHLVEVFREVYRVLRDNGVLWLNIADTYANDRKWGGHSSGKHCKELHAQTRPRRYTGLPGKNLLMIPARVAIALQSDGWILRSDCIWSKPAPMPQSVRDRPTTSHEHVFLLTKRPDYFYDADAVAEPACINEGDKPATRNRRSVWSISATPFPGSHFAVMPQKLAELCILSGSSPQTCECCGSPWKRETEHAGMRKTSGPVHLKIITAHEDLKPVGKSSAFRSGMVPIRETIGWQPTCRCKNNTGSGRCIVLDPFSGAGTSCYVASRFGRDYLGIELNPDYVALAEKRLAELTPGLWGFSERSAQG